MEQAKAEDAIEAVLAKRPGSGHVTTDERRARSAAARAVTEVAPLEVDTHVDRVRSEMARERSDATSDVQDVSARRHADPVTEEPVAPPRIPSRACVTATDAGEESASRSIEGPAPGPALPITRPAGARPPIDLAHEGPRPALRLGVDLREIDPDDTKEEDGQAAEEPERRDQRCPPVHGDVEEQPGHDQVGDVATG